MTLTGFDYSTLRELYRRVDEKKWQRRNLPCWENWTFNRIKDRLDLELNRRYMK